MVDALGKHPPKPRLALRFGITGHRREGLPTGRLPALKDELHNLFTHASGIVKSLWQESEDFFSRDEPALRLVSSLAEGADRLAAWTAFECGFELQSILPFSEDDYRRDFESSESRHEYAELLRLSSAVFEVARERPDETADSLSYEAAGQQMLKTCDVLVAIWDGKQARGRGGSAEIVEAALAMGRPVIWLDSETASPAKLIPPGTQLSLLRGPPPANPIGADALSELLEGLLLGPFRRTARRLVEEDDPKVRFAWFLDEKEPRITVGVAYPLLLFATGIRALRWSDAYSPRPGDRPDPEWDAVLTALSETNPDDAAKLRDIVFIRYRWADRLANYYAQLYRSSYVRNFCLAAAAVILAVTGLLSPEDKPVLVLVELALIGIILATTLLGQSRKWHQRWLDYRHMAELLRPVRILYLLGTELGSPGQQRGEAGEIEAHWFGWYFRASLRELGLVGAKCNTAYLARVRDLLHATEVKGQMDYNAANAIRMHRLEERLDLLGTGLFFTTGAVCITYLLEARTAEALGVKETFDHTASFLTTAFPAVGAALYAIREQGDFKGVAERSRQMVRRLSRIETSLPEGGDSVAHGMAHLTALAELAAESMIGDLADWRFVFRRKQLSLPA